MPVKTCVYVFMSIMCLLTSMTTTSQNSSGHTVITVPNVYDSGLNKHPATSYQSKMRYPILLNEDKMRLNGKGIDQAVTYQGYSNIAYTKQSVYLMLFAVCFLSAVFVSFVIRTDIKQAILLYLTTQSLMTPFVKAQPTPSPTYAAPVISSCGSYRSCYYLNIAPLPGVAVSRTIDVQGGWPWIFPVDSYFEIYVTPKGHPCVDPSISVAYEAIDYDDAEDTLSVNASGTIIATCGGSTPKACGTFESCLSGYNLGIAQIYGEQQAKLVTIQRSASVGADCSPLHDYAINVQLTITCSAQTGHPTASPTRLPSSPSSAPTEITTQPTQSPTYADPVISSCGTYRSCYYLNIAPMPDVNVTRTINVTGPDVPGYDSFFEIHLTAKGHPCTNPSVTVTYERIDYDNAGETFSVNASGTIIATCGGSTLNSCGAFASCLSGYNLPITQIESEEQTRLMTIKRESVVDAMCSHDYAINVRLTITCSAKTGHPTASPTRLPSLSPTNVPSTQSPTDVTSQPTLSPTYAAPVINSSCGSHRTCYYLNIAPIPGITISRTIDVQEIGGSYDSYFEIYVTPKGHSCTDPSITLTYERIDYDSPTETLSVNASGTEIATCGGSTSNLCDSFASCLSGYYLGITQLDSEQEAQLITIKRDSSVRYSTSCSHNYAVNVHLTITCSAKTGQPTTAPPTPSPTATSNDPTKAPTRTPTIATVSPTPNPTTKISCGSRRTCYTVDAVPMYLQHASASVPIQGGWYSAPTFYDITFDIHGSVACNHPSIDFRFERIDYDTTNERLYVDYNGTRIASCGNVSNLCGSYSTCISQYALTNDISIQVGQNITVNVERHPSVEEHCSHSWAINAILTLNCDDSPTTTNPPTKHTVEPTLDPSMHPTSIPSPSPTHVPTAVTSSPTPNPTMKSSCGSYRTCYTVDAVPIYPKLTSVSVPVGGGYYGTSTYYDVTFYIHGTACNHPSIDFVFERIDYDAANEQIYVDYNGTRIASCGGDVSRLCGSYSTCISQYALTNDIPVEIGQNITVNITRTAAVQESCGHSWAINAILTLNCDDRTSSPTASPTAAPSYSPTAFSLSPTVAPTTSPTTPPTAAPTLHPTDSPSQSPTDSTVQPTPSPTYADLVISSCGVYKSCYYLNIAPIPDVNVSRTINVTGTDPGFNDYYFDIFLTAKGHPCTGPSITITYERIDYESAGETFSVSASGTTIVTCGGSTPNSCGTFASCLSGYNLPITQIYSEQQTLLMTIKIESTVDARCSHDYAINAQLIITCSAKT
eukprot:1027588_1